jgi:UDP-N-acetylglucosamine 2-epimerase (non-hydrolysing)
LVEEASPSVEIPDEPFVLATSHRLETICRRKRLGRVVDLLNRFAERFCVVFVLHGVTARYMEKFGLSKKLDSRVRVVGMQDYINFSALLKASSAVLTDGGSIQEECFHLNKPCLILRRRTERPDGLGKNALLWRFDNAIAGQFIANLQNFRASDNPTGLNPSARIVDVLIEEGFGTKQSVSDH